MEQTACEDLKAFERRLTEVISHMQPSVGRWRVILIITSVCTAIGGYQWIFDPRTGEVGFMNSLYNHLFFTTSLFLLLILFLCGIHKRVVAPSIIASRCRQTLADFNMSCDDGWKKMDERVVWSESVFLLNIVALTIMTFAIVFGGAIPYFFQYREIQRTQNARGFSLFVCLNLLAANILRVMFWFGKKFEIQLLLQSVVMIMCMMMMIQVVVKTNRKTQLPPRKHHSVWDGDIMASFWSWTDFSSYVAVISLFASAFSLLTNFFMSSEWYIEVVGFAALFLEGNLGTPQLYTNWKRHSTVGMSVRMVLMWTVGDISKTVYFIIRQTPSQFWLCGIFQIGIDAAILCQVVLYRGSAHHKLDSTPS